jgi:hypothetical protein
VTKKNPEDGSVQSRNICRVSLKCFKDLHIFRIKVHPVGVLNSDCQKMHGDFRLKTISLIVHILLHILDIGHCSYRMGQRVLISTYVVLGQPGDSMSVTSGFRRDANEICALLGFYAT